MNLRWIDKGGKEEATARHPTVRVDDDTHKLYGRWCMSSLPYRMYNTVDFIQGKRFVFWHRLNPLQQGRR
jgi:hypothetical protein